MKDKDILEKYISAGMSEKAPDGFTNKVMTRIMFEKAVSREESLFQRLKIPITVGLISVVLIAFITIFSSPSENLWLKAASDAMQNITFKMPSLSDGIVPTGNIPVIIIYTCIAIFLLSLFDIGLKNLFHRKN